MSEVRVEARRESPSAMFLRNVLVTGTGDDGLEVELALSGAALVLNVQSVQTEGSSFEAGRIVETIRLADLIEAWAKAVDAEGATDD